MDIQEQILAELRALNKNITELKVAFDRHTHPTGVGPTEPIRARATTSKWETKRFSDVQAELAEALNKEYASKYQSEDESFFFRLGLGLPEMSRMQMLAGIKPKKLGAYDQVKDLPKDLPDEMFEEQLHKAVADHVEGSQRMGYIAKGYGCKDAARCEKPHPHYEQDCVINPFRNHNDFTLHAAKMIYDNEGPESLRRRAPASVDVDKLIAMWGPPSNWTPDPGAFDDEEKTDPIIKPPTQDLKAQRKKEGLCPECGKKGDWVNMACICPDHGRFMG